MRKKSTYPDHIEQRRDQNRAKRETKEKVEEAKDTSWEAAFLDKFYGASETALGVVDKDYGRDRRFIRRLSGKATPELLTGLIDTFFDCSNGRPWLFGNGSVLQFTKTWVRLQVEKEKDVAEVRSVVPVSLTG